MYETLTGENIRLRKARESDCISMLEHVWGDEDVYKWMLFAPTMNEAEAVERCRRSIQYQKDHYAYFIALRDSDEAIGMCAICETSPGHFEESGICIGKRYQGRGYGKEIMSLLLDLAFEKLDAEDFRYGYFENNIRSGKLADYFGFRYEKTYELTREYDGESKTIRSCVLSRDEYSIRREELTASDLDGKLSRKGR